MKNSEEYKKTRREFWQKYTDYLLPKLEKYEKERKKQFYSSISIIILSVIIVIGYFIYCFITNSASMELGVLNLIVGAFFIEHLIQKSFEKKVKRKIMPLVCSCFGNLYWVDNYDKTEKIHELKKLYELGLVRWYDQIKIDDAFVGEHKNVKFDIVESKLFYRSDKTVTVFDGVIIKFNMNKNFDTHTVIIRNGAYYPGVLDKLHQTELEDIEFEQIYNVYTDNDVEARYLITPSFMERLKNVELAFKGNISCAFYKEQLILAISTDRDLFSICYLSEPTYDSKQFATMFDEIYSLIHLIDYFKLDQKIGL